MRTTATILILSVALSAPCLAQSLAQRARIASFPIDMTCVRTAAGGSKNITWQTNYGSGEREINRTLTYKISVRWSGSAPLNAQLNVWFVGTPARGGKDFILDDHCLDITLKPSVTLTQTVTSDEISHRKTDYVAIGITEREGARLRGCVVQLIIDGDVIRAYSSLGHLKQAMWHTPFGSYITGRINCDNALNDE